MCTECQTGDGGSGRYALGHSDLRQRLRRRAHVHHLQAAQRLPVQMVHAEESPRDGGYLSLRWKRAESENQFRR